MEAFIYISFGILVWWLFVGHSTARVLWQRKYSRKQPQETLSPYFTLVSFYARLLLPFHEIVHLHTLLLLSLKLYNIILIIFRLLLMLFIVLFAKIAWEWLLGSVLLGFFPSSVEFCSTLDLDEFSWIFIVWSFSEAFVHCRDSMELCNFFYLVLWIKFQENSSL